MSSRDVRAVENPISAIFDLAEDVTREALRVRKLFTYASVFILLMLLLLIPLTVAILLQNPIIGLLFLVVFILGVISLRFLGGLNDFLKYYVRRHSAIISVRTEDPVMRVPAGATAIERLLRSLSSRNPQLVSLISGPPQPGRVRGESGVFYSFDAYFLGKPGPLWKSMGIGYPGYQMFVKVFSSAPKAEDFMFLKHAAEDVAVATKAPPSRVIALWSRKPTEDISEDAYSAVTSQTVLLLRRGKKYACSLELIIENEDGTYEFIPYIVEGI